MSRRKRSSLDIGTAIDGGAAAQVRTHSISLTACQPPSQCVLTRAHLDDVTNLRNCILDADAGE